MAGYDITLSVDPACLEKTSAPKFQKPREVAIFSATENTERQDGKPKSASRNSPSKTVATPSTLASDLDRYSVDGPWRSAVSEDPASGRETLVDPESLKQVCFDLYEGNERRVDAGIKREICMDVKQELINMILQCLDKEGLVNKSEFVCQRGILNKIASSPYCAGKPSDEGLKIVAQKYQGVIYMVNFPMRMTEKDADKYLGDHIGYKFESCVTAKSEQNQKRYGFFVVVNSKLGSHSLITAGEVDCSLPNNPKHYVELKTTAEIKVGEQKRAEDHPHLIFAKPKFLSWWLQSFLIGIEDILYGVRDDQGVVRKCEWLKVSEIPYFGTEERAHWNPAICMKFLNEFLTFAKENITESLVPHVFTRSAGVREFQMTIDREGDYKFLPFWFVDKMSDSD